MEASNVKAMREALEFAKYEFCARGLSDASKQMEAALSAPPRNCDRPECATTKEAQDVWRQEDGGKTAYYEWLLATFNNGALRRYAARDVDRILVNIQSNPNKHPTGQRNDEAQ